MLEGFLLGMTYGLLYTIAYILFGKIGVILASAIIISSLIAIKRKRWSR